MCGGAAMLLANPEASCSTELYESLNVLQHRGQDAAGIITCQHGRLYQVKGNGLVKDVFSEAQMKQLVGNMGVGHVRYPTAGTSSPSEAQPFYVNSPYGIVLAHNGNLNNSEELKEYLFTNAHRHINTDSDSEMLLNVLADELQRIGKQYVDEDDVFAAIKGVMQRCRGAYACFAMITGYAIIGFRDPHGIRPIIHGTRQTAAGVDHILCSESVGLTALGFTSMEDLRPGEGIVITKDGKVTRRQCVTDVTLTPCLFEYVYFARPDSILDGISVYQARVNMGDALADLIRRKYSHLKIDTVIPVPDTSRTAALQCAQSLGIPYREGLTKNRYVARTFIMPGQDKRKQAVRRKLSALHTEFLGKNVLLVDDSIVRGTTSREIIVMAREAGAANVYFASCSPPIRFPNVYGIDMPSFKELVAYERTEQEVAKLLLADEVIYLELDALVEACRSVNPSITQFESSVFTGEYITGDITLERLAQLEAARVGKKANGSPRESDPIGLFNLNSH